MPSLLPDACWVVHDGKAGNRRQAMALAAAMQLDIHEWTLPASLGARWFAPRKFPGFKSAFGWEFSDALMRAPPALAIGCGRLAALATRMARDTGAKSIQILDPRIDPDLWDLVVAPAHDRLVGSNVLAMSGSLSPVDAGWLARARAEFPALSRLPSPRTAVLLGGPTAATRFDRSALEVLCSKLEYQLAGDGGSVMICGSRRTPAAWAALMRERYAHEQQHLVWMDAGDGVNPYPGVLGWADRIIVSPDSVNMISEACATSAPVFVAEPNRATGRIGSFIASLLERGRVLPQTRDCAPFPAIALEETRRVAALVRERLSRH